MSYAKHDFDAPKKVVTFWGREWEIVGTIYCEEYAPEYYHPSGELDWSKLCDD